MNRTEARRLRRRLARATCQRYRRVFQYHVRTLMRDMNREQDSVPVRVIGALRWGAGSQMTTEALRALGRCRGYVRPRERRIGP